MTDEAGPLTADEFATLLDRLGPFEPAPLLAVAVSGGADSLALTLLADGWARRRGGRILALTVDHGLRAASAGEAAQVGRWLTSRGIAHDIVTWDGDKPATGIQAAARAARHRLLAARCRAAGILHLLMAHHRDDQAETHRMRAARASGPDGLAGMAAVREEADLRLLRPLLEVPKARLVATCRAADQDWIEDPSNRDSRFARSALRAAGLDGAGLAGQARAAGLARRAAEESLAILAAEAATVHPEGWVELDGGALGRAQRGQAVRLLARCLDAVGGAAWPPEVTAVGRLLERLLERRDDRAAAGATLAGCDIRWWHGGVRIIREEGRLAPPAPLTPGRVQFWDGRFEVCLGEASQADSGFAVGALGRSGGAQLSGAGLPPPGGALPAAVRRTLPALWQGGMVMSVPHLSYVRSGADGLPFTAVFRPPRAAVGPAFSVVSQAGVII